MAIHIKNKEYRNEFDFGYTPIVKIGESDDTGIELGIRVLKPFEKYESAESDKEICALLLNGKVNFNIENLALYYQASRNSVFNQEPVGFTVSKNTNVCVENLETITRLIEIKTLNPRNFKPQYIFPRNVKIEERGKELLGNTAYRLVKTIFDKKNAPDSNLVIGEVINLPGKWSSYPPHHHPQPEIYFYQFEPKQGFGFAQIGDKVVKVQDNDAIKILDGADHPQVAAPGYVMWYLWVIKHLPNNPYLGFEYDLEHEWLLNEKAKIWQPKKRR